MIQIHVKTAERVLMWVLIHLNVRVQQGLEDQHVKVKKQ